MRRASRSRIESSHRALASSRSRVSSNPRASRQRPRLSEARVGINSTVRDISSNKSRKRGFICSKVAAPRPTDDYQSFLTDKTPVAINARRKLTKPCRDRGKSPNLSTVKLFFPFQTGPAARSSASRRATFFREGKLLLLADSLLFFYSYSVISLYTESLCCAEVLISSELFCCSVNVGNSKSVDIQGFEIWNAVIVII